MLKEDGDALTYAQALAGSLPWIDKGEGLNCKILKSYPMYYHHFKELLRFLFSPFTCKPFYHCGQSERQLKSILRVKDLKKSCHFLRRKWSNFSAITKTI